MRPSVWIFCDTPPGGAYGASYMAVSWDRELRALGWDSRLVAPSGSIAKKSSTPESLTFRSLTNISYHDDAHAIFSLSRQLWRARKNLPDVVLVTTPLRIGAFGFALSYWYNVPLVVAVSTDTTQWAEYNSSVRTIVFGLPKLAGVVLRSRKVFASMFKGHRPGTHKPKSFSAAFAGKVVDAMNGRAAELLILGERREGEYVLPHPHQRISIFAAGVDRLPEPTEPPEIPWREGALRVLCVGRMSREKSTHVIIDAVAEATKRGLDVHLAMVGGGNMHDDLLEQAKRLGIADRATLHGPYLRDNLRSVYESADVFAFASRFETQGFVVNEAAHEGLPLLMADAINPVVVDGESAVVVDQTATAFADGMERLMDPELRARLGAGAKHQAGLLTEAEQVRKLSVILTRTAKGQSATELREVKPLSFADEAIITEMPLSVMAEADTA